MLVANTFAAFAAVTIFAVSGLVFLYIENHRPVYYVEGTKKHTVAGKHTVCK